MSLRCHAGSRHLPARNRGAYGDLCDECWLATKKLVEQVIKKPVKEPSPTS